MAVLGEATHAGGALTEPSYAAAPVKAVSAVAQVEYVAGAVVAAAIVVVSKRLYYRLPYTPQR